MPLLLCCAHLLLRFSLGGVSQIALLIFLEGQRIGQRISQLFTLQGFAQLLAQGVKVVGITSAVKLHDEGFSHALGSIDRLKLLPIVNDTGQHVICLDHRVIVGSVLIADKTPAIALKVIASGCQFPAQQFLGWIYILTARGSSTLGFQGCALLTAFQHFRFIVSALVIAVCLTLARFFIHSACIVISNL